MLWIVPTAPTGWTAAARTDTLVIRGFDGDDTLYGGLKGDRIAGGDGHNVLYGGDGNDGIFISPIEAIQHDLRRQRDRPHRHQLTVEQYATPEIRAALSQLDYFMAEQPADPTTDFVKRPCISKCRASSRLVRVDATDQPGRQPGARRLRGDLPERYREALGTDYTLGSRWVVDGANFVRGETFATVERAWHIIGSADFNGDLKADVLWQHEDDRCDLGLDHGWRHLPVRQHGPHAGSRRRVEVFGTGDFTGDGRAEILMTRTVTDPGTGLAYADLRS